MPPPGWFDSEAVALPRCLALRLRPGGPLALAGRAGVPAADRTAGPGPFMGRLGSGARRRPAARARAALAAGGAALALEINAVFR